MVVDEQSYEFEGSDGPFYPGLFYTAIMGPLTNYYIIK